MMERKKNLGLDLEATGDRIDKAMKRKGYTPQMIADLMGLTYQSVWKWSKGESIPDVENLLILSRILDTTMDELVVSFDSLERRIEDIVSDKVDWVKAIEKKNLMRENIISNNRKVDYLITGKDGTELLVECKGFPRDASGRLLEHFKRIS